MKRCLLFSIMSLVLLLHGVANAVTVRDVVFTTDNLGKVVFSHRDHTKKKGLTNNCRVCHDRLYNLRQKKHYSMADMEQGKSCGTCHNGKRAFGVDKCVACHPVKEIAYKVKETGPTYFSHKKHLEVAGCAGCHPALYAANEKNRRVGMAAMTKGKSCGACHNAKEAFSVTECARCHPVRELVFEEKSTGNVAFSHKFHMGLYSCGECHTSLFRTTRSKVVVTMTKMEQGKSCGGCHDGKTAFSVKDKCESCHKM